MHSTINTTMRYLSDLRADSIYNFLLQGRIQPAKMTMISSAMRKETRTVLSITTPLMAAYTAEMGMMITDMIIVGRLGSKELAAVGLTADWFYVLLLIGMGVVSIVSVIAAQKYGEGDAAGVISAVEQGLIVAGWCSVPVILAVWFLGPALSFANQDPKVIQLITAYSRPLALSVLPALWFVVLRNYVTAIERASGIMIITVAALILNLFLNLGLVLGYFGMPALGVVGAAWGTTIVTWLMFLVLAVHVARSSKFAGLRPSLFPRTTDAALAREIVALGLPVTAAQFLSGAMFTVAAILVGMISADILAAQLIVYSVIYLCLSANVAFGDAIRVRVAYGVGLGSATAVRTSSAIVLVLAITFVFSATLFLWFAPEVLVGIFLNISDPTNLSVLQIAVGLAIFAGVFQLFDGIQMIFANGLRGLRDTTSPMWFSLVGFWIVGIGSGTLLCFPMGYGAQGLWWGLIAGAFVTTSLMAQKFLRNLSSLND